MTVTWERQLKSERVEGGKFLAQGKFMLKCG